MMSGYSSMLVTAHHIVDNLSNDLYKDPGQCIWELWRNGVVASNANGWDPRSARIENDLVPNHPLTPRGTSALQVLDHGSGLTEGDALERYFSLGRQITKMKKGGRSSHGGAAQKGIGRLAALALNSRCLPVEDEDDDAWLERVTHGFYIFSRTSDSGPVRFIKFTPKDVEDNAIDKNRFISPNAAEMGPLMKDIKGSFTAIVIPTPVFKNHKDIYEAAKWYLPRERDKMFPLYIGGEQMFPPPLEEHLNIVSVDGTMRARIGPWKPVGNENEDGIWLCDSATGLRVQSCNALGHTRLPAPIWSPELRGEIFCPGLLENQNTARSALTAQFMNPNRKNSQWNRLYGFLSLHVCDKAEELLNREPIEGDVAKTVGDIVDMFHRVFGEPESNRRLTPTPTPGPKPPRTKPEKGTNEESRKRTPRHSVLKVDDKEYVIYMNLSLPEYVFAEVDMSNAERINVNARGGYKSLPTNHQARFEHALMHMLIAIGRSQLPDDPSEAIVLANQLREKFAKSKVKPPKKA